MGNGRKTKGLGAVGAGLVRDLAGAAIEAHVSPPAPVRNRIGRRRGPVGTPCCVLEQPALSDLATEVCRTATNGHARSTEMRANRMGGAFISKAENGNGRGGAEKWRPPACIKTRLNDVPRRQLGNQMTREIQGGREMGGAPHSLVGTGLARGGGKKPDQRKLAGKQGNRGNCSKNHLQLICLNFGPFRKPQRPSVMDL